MKQEIYTSKFYISKRNGKEVCFKLDFEIKAFEENQKFYYVEIYAIIDYQYLKNEIAVIPNTNKNRNHWILRYDFNSWNFHSSIMLHSDYRSLGIGTFVINKMLEMDNNKEFKILRLNKQEILKIGGYGICDSCNRRLSNDGYMICVLYSCYCEKCYKEWYKVAINHKEDREIEKDVYENIKSKITNIYF
ncbi:hypothetical protein ACTK2J_001821 [Campylobacter jejuni]